jgi:type IV secretory pathway TraG/TraD family ATPase VirD4
MTKHKHELLMLMDNSAAMLGKMPMFPDTIAFIAGYGVKVAIGMQSPGDLVSCYGERGAQQLEANMHTQIAIDADGTTVNLVGRAPTRASHINPLNDREFRATS